MMMTENSKDSSLLKFPCDFPIKIMGKATDAFKNDIFSILKKHYPALKTDAIHMNSSKNGNFIAMSATVFAQDQPSLDALYQDLTQHPDIKMVL
ncbi:MAG: DUF493 domain-containing protein [Legionella sp.]|jgi:hypothetical protein|nr:DUF493 domain-containing protein [Legionella sp.]